MRPDSLNETELFQAMMNSHGIMLTIQNSYYLVEEGTLDEKIKQSLVASIIAVKDNPGFKLFWKTRKDLFFPEFQIYVEELIKSDKKYSRELYSIE
jgi:precorrin-2 methylase